MEQMQGFGYKTGWLAVRRPASAGSVLDALGCDVVGPAGWAEGVRRSYTDDAVVAATPLLGDGWLLAFGFGIARRADWLDVASLSSTLESEVQLFVSHRVVELHRWERAVDGDLVRSFEYVGESGEVTRWQGQPGEVEQLPPSFDFDVLVGERDVMRVAGAWSVDPTSLDGQPAPGPLLLGRFRD